MYHLTPLKRVECNLLISTRDRPCAHDHDHDGSQISQLVCGARCVRDRHDPTCGIRATLSAIHASGALFRARELDCVPETLDCLENVLQHAHLYLLS